MIKTQGPPPVLIDRFKRYTACMILVRGWLEFDLHISDRPELVNNFVYPATNRLYCKTVFHRVVSQFVVQGGDIQGGAGTGGPGYYLPT